MDQMKRRWSPEEDHMLLNLAEKHGLENWSLISESLPGRSGLSCSSRWFSLQRSFTPEEDEMLQNLLEKHGPNWSLISESIP
ncbi:transcription factor MYB44-like protein, partial [Tanacetum coccineum]